VLHVAGLAGRQVTLTIQGDTVTLTDGADGAVATDAAAGAQQQQGSRAAAESAPARATLSAAPASAWDGEWVLTLDQFAPGAVGQKAMSTTNLHKAAAAAAGGRRSGSSMQLPEWVKLPASVALPHGSFEAVLRAPLNRDNAGRLQELVERIAAVAERQPGNPEACAAELDEIRWVGGGGGAGKGGRLEALLLAVDRPALLLLILVRLGSGTMQRVLARQGSAESCMFACCPAGGWWTSCIVLQASCTA
jgi:hypothetical protein